MTFPETADQAAAYRVDGWQNPLTGLGTDRDKMTQGSYWAPFRLQDSELLACFNGSDLGARIVESTPKEMMRRGYSIELDTTDESDESDPEAEEPDETDVAKLLKYGQRLRLDEQVTDAGVWGNLFGGCLLVIGAQDGAAPDQPLQEKNISTVRFINTYDRRFVFVHSYYSDPLAPNYGLPETYLITRSVSGLQGGPAAVIVHESRCVRFDGARTDILTRQQLAGWSWSLLQRAYEPLRAFEQGFQACYNLMSDASQAVFKMQGLISMLASNEKDVLQTRMALVDMSRSVCRAVLLDAENEDFERKSTSFAGLPDLLDRFMMRLSAAVGIPVAILMGRSAAGMNATGDADFRAYYGMVASEQENVLGPKLKRIYHILACAKDGPLHGDYDFRVNFNTLYQPSDTEQADIELKTSQKDAAYITAGVVQAETVALSRWGKKGFNGVGMASFDSARAEQDAADEKMFGGMLEPPKELQGQGAAGQGEGQTLASQLPGPVGGEAAPPIGAAASPYGVTKDPVKVMRDLHQPPETDQR
jgi:uncharacterized protein